jgi:hypothetical protein
MTQQSNTQSNDSDTSNTIQIIITDEELTRLLDVQESDGTKWDATTYHLFQLGLGARENSIKATLKRKSAEEQQLAKEKIASFLRINPALAQVVCTLQMEDAALFTDSVKLLTALALEVAKQSLKTKSAVA